MGVSGPVSEQGNDVELASGRLLGLAFLCGRSSQAGTSKTKVSAH